MTRIVPQITVVSPEELTVDERKRLDRDLKGLVARLDIIAEQRGLSINSVRAFPCSNETVESILARHGETAMSPEDFEKHFGHLPTDDEG
jgi:hypothetical protein